MPLQVFFFALLVVSAIGIGLWVMRGVNVDLPSRNRKVVRANLGPSVSTAPDLREVVLSQPLWERVGRPAIRRSATLARRISPKGLLESMEAKRGYAGLDARWSLEKLLALKLLLGFTGAFLGLLVFGSNPTTLTLLAAILFTLVGFFVVDIVLDARARERRTEIEQTFPNTIDQVTICVESGLGLDGALAHAARTGSGPLAEELDRVLQDIRAGVPRQTALEGMAERTDVSDIRHFVMSIGQANRYGVPIAKALRVLATESRDRRRARAEERAEKMSVKMLFPLIFCILPSLFVILLGPAAIRIGNMSLSGH